MDMSMPFLVKDTFLLQVGMFDLVAIQLWQLTKHILLEALVPAVVQLAEAKQKTLHGLETTLASLQCLMEKNQTS